MRLLFTFICLAFSIYTIAQKPDYLCTNSPPRAWWDVQQYDLSLRFHVDSTSISGKCIITAKVIKEGIDSLQIDLATPLNIDSIIMFGKPAPFSVHTGTYFVKGNFSILPMGTSFNVTIYYSGQPRQAKNAPWDAGFILKQDASGQPWLAVTCQNFGAHAWFPCKSFPGDEPERVITHFEVPENLSAIGNGRLISTVPTRDGKSKVWTWLVTNPINNYDITFYIGDYVHWQDTFQGKKGPLSLDYYVLPQNLEKAREQFDVVKSMLQCFEEKLGPYPFYEDGYKLVDAPYLGMEHQSAVAYGNNYNMGYLGRDLSGTGVGLLFDFIIVHESAHEWFGNSITVADVADTWVQEGFTTYCETIFTECLFGKEKAFEYIRGTRSRIHNDRPSQGDHGACDGGSADHYVKGAFVAHMIRMIMRDDVKFFSMLVDMNYEFYHKTVTGSEIEQFISTYSGIDFSPLFDQYLRTKDFPVLVWDTKGTQQSYRWEKCVPMFNMPLLLTDNTWIYPTTSWQAYDHAAIIAPTQDFLVEVKNKE